MKGWSGLRAHLHPAHPALGAPVGEFILFITVQVCSRAGFARKILNYWKRSGGFGTVAPELLYPRLAASQGLIERLRREARSAAWCCVAWGSWWCWAC